MLLHSLLDSWAQRQPDAEFAVQRDRRLTYGQARLATNQLANVFVRLGLRKGDRIAMLAGNCIEYALIYFAASRAGVVPVPLNYRAAPAEWAHAIRDSGAKLVIVSEPYRSAVDAILDDLQAVERFMALDAPGPTPGWDDLRRLVAAQSADPPDRRVGPDDDLYQIYTSGTTGQPKGAVLTQRAVVANLDQIGTSDHRGGSGERSLVAAPMLHAGVVWSALAPLAWGGSLYILDEFDPERAARAMSEERIGYAVLVPTMLQMLLAQVPDLGERPYPALRLIHTGSAPISEQTLLGARTAFGCDVVHGYGLTEATAAVTAMAPADYERALGDRPERVQSVGRALADTELRIVDEHGTSLPTGAIGEIAVRGPQVMRGYWQRPDATAEVLRDGWLRTGDVGLLDDEGYLYIRDRAKDMIVTGGLNVYPRMIEQVLLEHPDVADVTVIGVPDDRWGEAVKAVVVRRSGGAADEAELIDFCRARLGSFQRPRSVDFVEALPRTATGKVLKRALREGYWAGNARLVGAV